MTWKVPIPTNLDEQFGNDYRCVLLFKELILRACRFPDTPVQLEMHRKTGTVVKTVILQRGQALYGRNKYSRYLCWTASTVDRALIKLEKTYKQVNNQRDNDYTVVTIQNYDELVEMNNQMDKQRTTSEHIGEGKEVKEEKKEEKQPMPETKESQQGQEQQPGRFFSSQANQQTASSGDYWDKIGKKEGITIV